VYCGDVINELMLMMTDNDDTMIDDVDSFDDVHIVMMILYGDYCDDWCGEGWYCYC
jgi:hypothetical protein